MRLRQSAMARRAIDEFVCVLVEFWNGGREREVGRCGGGVGICGEGRFGDGIGGVGDSARTPSRTVIDRGWARSSTCLVSSRLVA
jgi:hypothetical protein